MTAELTLRPIMLPLRIVVRDREDFSGISSEKSSRS